MKSLYLLIALLFTVSNTSIQAQKTLEGVWEGTISIGGIHSQRTLPMELYILIDGSKVEGRSYVRTPDGQVIQMDLRGTLYGDNSMQLMETNFVGDVNNDYLPSFSRQYQIDWKADLWDARVEGFWQEKTGETFANFRRRGRIKLKKSKDPGA